MLKRTSLIFGAVLALAGFATFYFDNTTDAAMPPGLAATVSVSLDKSQVVRGNSGPVTATATVGANFSNDSVSESSGTWGNDTTNTISWTCGSTPYTSNQSRTWTRVTRDYTSQYFTASSNAGTPTSAGDGTFTVTQSVPSADGSYTITMSVTATEAYTDYTTTFREYRHKNGGTLTYKDCGSAWTAVPNGETAVSGPTATGSGSTTSSSVSGSGTYAVDLIAPTAGGTMSGSGNITAGGSIDGSIDFDGGSIGQKVKVTLSARQGLTPYASGSTEKDITRNSMNIGPLGLDIGCEVALGAYSLDAKVESTDIAGNAWDPIEFNVGTFNVNPGVNLSAQTEIVAQDANGDYTVVPYFTVTTKKVKGVTSISASPATTHHASLLQVPGRCNDVTNVSFSDDNPDLIITPATGFSYVQTGQSPYAHVFAGELPNGTLFDYHDPNLVRGENLSAEITSLVTQTVPDSTQGGRITVNLKNLGTIPATWKVYVRAKMRYSGASAPSTGALFNFADFLDNVNNSNPAYPMSNNATYCFPYMGSNGQVVGCN